MKNHFYFEVMRRTIVQFLNLFNDIRIARYDNTGKLDKYIKVPLKFAPKSKYWWWEEKFDNNQGRTIREVLLPHVAIAMTGIEPADSERSVNKNFRVRSNKRREAPLKYERFDNPIPYNFKFQVEIASQYMIDINQIIEQILPFFNPTAYIRITIPDLNVDHKENVDDEGAYPIDLKVIYDGGNFETNIDMGSDEYRVIKWTLDFTVEGYLFRPNIATPIIEHALLNYFDYEQYLLYGESYPLISTITTGLSSEKWPVTISGGISGLPSGAIYSDNAKLWYTYESYDTGITSLERVYTGPWEPPYSLVGSNPGPPLLIGEVGSVLFIGADGDIHQNPDDFFWHDGENKLGIGTDSPDTYLHIANTGAGDYLTVQRTDTGDDFVVNFGSSTHLKTTNDMVFDIGDAEIVRIGSSSTALSGDFNVSGDITSPTITSINSDIQSLSASLTASDTSIVAQHTADILSLSASISASDTGIIDQHALDILSLSGSIDTNISNITSLNIDISSLSASITAGDILHSTDIAALSGAIDTNTSSIISINADTTFLSGAIDVNTNDITDINADTVFLSGAIDTNISNITSINADTAFLSGSIDGITDNFRETITTITSGTSACEIDLDTRHQVFYFTCDQDTDISVINEPEDIAWGVVLMLTNGGDYSISYDEDWQESGGTALTFTSGGTDRLIITGEGSDASKVIIAIKTDIR